MRACCSQSFWPSAGPLQELKAAAQTPSPEKENLNGEWVEIAHQGPSAQSFDKWTLEDSGNHTYTFKNFTLNPGASVKIHTGTGIDSVTDLYWGRSSPVWNNAGDIATLKDADGKIVSKYPDESEGAKAPAFL
jgi:competence protein ComEC